MLPPNVSSCELTVQYTVYMGDQQLAGPGNASASQQAVPNFQAFLSVISPKVSETHAILGTTESVVRLLSCWDRELLSWIVQHAWQASDSHYRAIWLSLCLGTCLQVITDMWALGWRFPANATIQSTDAVQQQNSLLPVVSCW